MASLALFCQFFWRTNNIKPKVPVFAKTANFCDDGKIFLISLNYLIKNDKNHFWAT